MDYNQNNFNDYMDTTYVTQPLRTPAKDIVCLVLGILSMFTSAMALIFCWYMPLGISAGITGAMYGIPVLIVAARSKAQIGMLAKKASIGRGLAIAAIIIGVLATIISIIIFFAMLATGVGAALYD